MIRGGYNAGFNMLCVFKKTFIKRGRKGTNALQPTVGADPCVCPNNNEQAACPYIPKLVGRRPPPAPPKEGSNRVCPYAGCSTIVPLSPFFPRCALKASPSSPSDSRPLSRGSKFAEMQDSNSFRLRFEQELRDFCRKVTNFRCQVQILRS